MKKHILYLLLFTSIVLNAGDKLVNKPTSEVASIEEENKSSLYVGLGSGWSRLSDDYTDEYFQMIPITILAGYKINEYLSIEGRYYNNISDVKYDNGNTFNQSSDDFDTDFEMYSAFLKINYSLNSFNPYLLLGYGEVELSNIMGASRSENSFQYGIGILYNYSEHFKLFVDYVKLYHDKGFDNRAIDRTIDVDCITFGGIYEF
jgi:opacity protein-like surface antigen